MYKEPSKSQIYKIDLTKSLSVFTRREKVIRIIWNFIWFFLSILPRQGSSIRIFVLRLFGATIGTKCLIETGVKIWIPWNLILHDFVAIGRQTEIYNYGKVEIESMTVISQYCYLCTGSHDYTHPYMPLIWKNIHIGSECWIAASTFVHPGVHIADGSVIGACSVVTKSMPSWMICAGNPCRPIRERTIKDLNIDVV